MFVDGLAISKEYITEGTAEAKKLEAKFLTGPSADDDTESVRALVCLC